MFYKYEQIKYLPYLFFQSLYHIVHVVNYMLHLVSGKIIKLLQT